MADYRPVRRGRGRPAKRVLPPRINVTAERLAQSVLRVKPPVRQTMYPEKALQCAQCERDVAYPEILYDDGRCADCHGLLGV